ncbi:hypothetical protein [Vulcanisaeta distributa]|uniref:hypothetical protein n=1 Tax=Vulcanisaeta distributa TaxID=164451 RepID=UPI0006D26166|nr:hypothetical protein [Vulcanisaeta distributa]
MRVPPPGIPVRLPNGTEINGPSLVNTTYDWIAFSNAWEGGKVVFQLYEPGTAMYDWAMSQWVDFKQSAAYEEFVAWAIRQYNAGELFNEVTSADIGTPPTNTTQVVVTLSFYNWTNPYTGWSWELYNVTSPFTGGAMVEETLKAMNITPTPPSQVMINGNNATLVFNNIPFGTTINITLPGGSYEGTSNCWASILRNVAGYYILTGIPNPISIQAYTNLNVDYIVVYAPEYTAGVCTFTP